MCIYTYIYIYACVYALELAPRSPEESPGLHSPARSSEDRFIAFSTVNVFFAV